MTGFVTMRTAMSDALLRGAQRRGHGHVVKAVVNANAKHYGEKHIPEWNAHLKYRTHQHLMEVGVMPKPEDKDDTEEQTR
jgi:hypothetical protein